MYNSTNEKDLTWFIANYPDPKERFLNISDYLHYYVDGKISIPDNTKNELFEALNQYWFDTVGLDIKEYLSNED